MGRLESEFDVLSHLNGFGVPVSIPIHADTGHPYVLEQGHVYTLSPALRNDQGQEPFDLRVVYANIGKALGRLHGALRAYQKPILSWHYDLPVRIFDEAVPRISEHLTESQAADLNHMVEALRPEMAPALSGLPEQHIHGDSHGSNILLHHGQVSGFIDLDHLPSGPRIYDLSYLMADMLKSRLYHPSAVRQCFHLFPALLSGYQDDTILSERERVALWYAMLAVQLMFSEVFFGRSNGEAAHRELIAFYSMCWQKEQIIRSIEDAPAAY